MADEKPIIIVKKKGGHGGHHGGAWKIAYADFVTAMMCFFMVMWLVNSADVTTRQNIASFFRRPGIFSEGSGTPLLLGGSGILEDAFAPIKPQADTGTGYAQSTNAVTTPEPTPKVRVSPSPKAEVKEQPKPTVAPSIAPSGAADQGKLSGDALERAAEVRRIKSVASEIQAAVAKAPELAKLLGIVNVKVEADGLQIDIMDTEKESMFNSGSAQILPEARQAFAALAKLIEKLPNKVDIIGHTDAKPFNSRTGSYTNWELSADRANAARRIMEDNGIPRDRISNVVGRADRDLLNEKDPFSASNRRITLKMRFSFTKNIDLSKDPSALAEIEKLENEESLELPVEESVIPGLPAPSPIPTAKPTKEVATSFKPRQIIKAAEKDNDKIVLPDEPEASSTGNTNSGKGAGILEIDPVVSNDLFAEP